MGSNDPGGARPYVRSMISQGLGAQTTSPQTAQAGHEAGVAWRVGVGRVLSPWGKQGEIPCQRQALSSQQWHQRGPWQPCVVSHGQVWKHGGGDFPRWGPRSTPPHCPQTPTRAVKEASVCWPLVQCPPPPETPRLRGDRARTLTPMPCLALHSQGPQVLGLLLRRWTGAQ